MSLILQFIANMGRGAVLELGSAGPRGAAPLRVQKQTTTHTDPASGGLTMTEKARVVGRELGDSLMAVLRALPGRPTRPSMLSRELGLNRATASKVLSSTAKRDPLALLHGIPGPEPLRSLLAAASTRGVADSLIQTAARAVERFDHLILNDAGTRGTLDAAISSALPSVREKLELTSKYSIFKGMSQLKGAQAETWLGTAVLKPSTVDPLRHDLTWLTGAFGVQRLRSEVTISFSYRSFTGNETCSAENEVSADSFSSVPMNQFCSNPPAPVLTQRVGEQIHYTLPGDSMGRLAHSDMIVVDDHPAAMGRYARPEPHGRSSLFVEPAFPVALVVFDLLLHKDAFPGVEPELVLYDTGTRGIANVNDKSRDVDLVHMEEQLEFLGTGLASFQCEEVPRYGEMLAHMSRKLDWDLGDYRGYRVKIQYPVYGWQASIAFSPPAAPKA
ncbi:MAG: hypothetical protein ACI89E_001161 [Planctomycetota bacterium]|jgi:hypothetical protein